MNECMCEGEREVKEEEESIVRMTVIMCVHLCVLCMCVCVRMCCVWCVHVCGVCVFLERQCTPSKDSENVCNPKNLKFSEQKEEVGLWAGAPTLRHKEPQSCTEGVLTSALLASLCYSTPQHPEGAWGSSTQCSACSACETPETVFSQQLP